MRNIFVALLLALFCLNLSGCGPIKTQSEIMALDYGPYPKNYQELVIQYMSRRLADPYSAHYQFQGQPTHQYRRGGMGYDEIYGWGGVVYINSKNKFGGYTGSKLYRYVIRYGNVVWMNLW